jgi:hypothetical protein
MKFYLRKKPVAAINDGSIVIKYSRHASLNRLGIWGITDGTRVIKPVVSIEVFLVSVFQLNHRQNERVQKELKQNGVMQDKSSAKC